MAKKVDTQYIRCINHIKDELPNSLVQRSCTLKKNCRWKSLFRLIHKGHLKVGSLPSTPLPEVLVRRLILKFCSKR